MTFSEALKTLCGRMLTPFLWEKTTENKPWTIIKGFGSQNFPWNYQSMYDHILCKKYAEFWRIYSFRTSSFWAFFPFHFCIISKLTNVGSSFFLRLLLINWAQISKSSAVHGGFEQSFPLSRFPSS